MTNEEKKELQESDMEKVAGGHVPLYNDGMPFENPKKDKDTHKDGGATGGW